MPRIMSGETYVGIDPGAKGAICVYQNGAFDFFRLKEKTLLEIFNYMEGIAADAHVVVEWINPGFIGSAKSSVAKLYGSYSALLMACTALSLRHITVKPTKWQKTIGFSPSAKEYKKRKQELRQFAQSMFPRVKITNETADALLIAYYARISQEGNSRCQPRGINTRNNGETAKSVRSARRARR